MGGNERREIFQHHEKCRGRCCTLAHRRPELAQEQNLRRLAGVVGGLPIPRACRVRAVKGCADRIAQRLRFDGAAAFETGDQQSGCCKKCCTRIR
jgi:hypothetical protein